MIFSERLKALRESSSFTQKYVADAIDITDRNYRRYEAGTTEPTLSILIALADLFKVSLDYLTGRTDER